MHNRCFFVKLLSFITLLICIEGFMSSRALAQDNVFHVVGEYIMSDDEIKSIAQERAVQIALADGIMQSAVYVKSLSKARDSQVSDDAIQAVAAGVVKIKQKKISSTLTSAADICIRAELTMEINSDEVEAYLPEVMMRWQLVEENKQLRLEYNRILSEVTELKKQLAQTKDEQQRKYIEEQIAVNEGMFSAMQWYEKGLFFDRKNDYEMGVECFNKAISMDSNKAIFFAQRGAALTDLGEYTDALNDLNHAVELDTNCMIAYYHRAWLKHVTNDYEGSLKDYSSTIRLSPMFFAAYMERANSYIMLKEYEAALRDCDNSIRLNKYSKFGLAMAYGTRSMINHLLGNEEASEEDKCLAIQFDPNYYNHGSEVKWKKRIS